jgi:rod shape-determining protein MreD
MLQNKIAFFRFYQVDFFIIYTIISTIFLKSYESFLICIALGFLQDLLSGIPLGINALSKFNIAYVTFLLINKININIKSVSLLIFFTACFVDFFILYIIGMWFNLYQPILKPIELLIKFLITSIVGCIIFILLKHLTKDSYLEYEE